MQDQIKLGTHWALTGSLRHDWAETETLSLTAISLSSSYNGNQSSSATTGRIGLVYLSTIGLAPYVSYSTSFLPQSGVSFAGQPFNPLTGKQYEAGLRYQPRSGWVDASVAVYSLTENNVLSTDPDTSHVGYSVETGQERSRGVEASATLHPAKGLNVIANYAYDDVRITKTTIAAQLGKIPFAVPTHQASAWTDYTFQQSRLKGFGLGAGVRYIGPTWMTSTDQYANPSRLFLDAMAHYDIGHWRAQLNVTNLADRRTGVCSNSICQFSQARTVIGSLKWGF